MRKRIYDKLVADEEVLMGVPLSSAVLVTADKIRTSIESSEDYQIFKDARDLCIAPIYQNVFIEAHSERIGNDLGTLICCVTPEEVAELKTKGEGMDKYFRDPEEIKWRFTAVAWSRWHGETVFVPAVSHFAADASGRLLDAKGDERRNVMVASLIKDGAKEQVELYNRLVLEATGFALFVISLIHCKHQIELVDSELPAQVRRKNRHAHVPKNVEKTLKIRASKGNAVLESILNGHPIATRQHGVRGHFKTFSESAPLLGHAVGTFFWATHDRGRRDKGKIEKAYEVEE